MKKRALAVWIFVAVAVTLLAGCGAAGGGGTNVSISDVGNVEGTVTDATSGAPVSGATVQVGDKSATTNASGVYSITDLAVGSRTITATKTGYQNYNGTVTVTKGTTITQNIQMTLTGAGDSTPPTVLSTDPADNATGIAINQAITVTFSEAMDCSTITTSSFTLKDNLNTAVAGTISTCNSTTAVFTPSSNLSYSTLYTATISTGVKDSAGNAMAANYTWNFTTGAASDSAAPTNTTATNYINGDATATNLTSITLSISATDDVGVAAYYVSENLTVPSASDSVWTTVTSSTSYSANVTYNLSTGGGTKTIYVWFKDGAGNVSTAVSDYIILSQAWALATVDSTGHEEYTSVGLDSTNNVHISYQDTTSFDLRYATNASGVWVTSTIDSTGWMGYFTSIAIDSNNKAHISYYDGNNRTLKYATNDVGTWTTYTIDSTANVGYYTSIAVDSNNKIHISYFDYTNKDLKYATNSAGSWSVSTIDNTDEVGWYPSIAIDSNNKVHISYYDGTNYTLKYATNYSGSWATYLIDNTGSYMWNLRLGVKSSIAISSGNKVHISYYDLTNQDLKYATNTSGSWVTTTIDSTGDEGFYNSISIDSQDKVHISYVDVSLGYLKYVTNTSGMWATYTIDKNIGDGWTSLSIDSNNKAHISYSTYDPAQYGALKYATNQ